MGVTTTSCITSLHEALQICDKALPATTPACTRGHCEHCDYDDHIHHFTQQPGTLSLKAITYVVSQGCRVRRFSR